MHLRETFSGCTGAESGIGRALAEAIHERAARLVLADRDVDGPRQVAADTGGLAVDVDVSVADDVEPLAALVRTGMSDIGDDPKAVASQALHALDQGSFAVFPNDGKQALVDRARRLAAGDPPVLPAPG